MPKRTLVAFSPGYISPKTFKHIAPSKSLSLKRWPTDEIAFFLLKVAALEAVRRLSRARCPFVWQAVKAFQCLCYPPLRWIQRWTPRGILVKGAQVLKPMTWQKLQVVAQTYLKVLSEFFQTVPAFLGGNCTCSNCRRLFAGNSLGRIEDTSKSQHHRNVSDDDTTVNSYPVTDLAMNNNSDHVPGAVMVVFLRLWIVIAFFVGMNDP